jgi:hypothetical protein
MHVKTYIMPLARHFTGEFPGAADRPHLAHDEAQQLVTQICDVLGGSLGADIRWNDAGDVILAQHFALEHWHALRAFAADITSPVPGFRFDSDAQQHPGLAAVWQGAPSPYVHLIVHRDATGYWFPVDFASPMVLPIYPDQDESMQPIVGSADALLRELDDIGQRLRLSRDQGQDGWTDQFESNDPLEPVKWGWVFLHHCARLAVQHRLPIIFEE